MMGSSARRWRWFGLAGVLVVAAVGLVVQVASVYSTDYVDPAGVVITGLLAVCLLLGTVAAVRRGLRRPPLQPLTPAEGGAGNRKASGVLVVDALTVDYGSVRALDGLSFTVGQGEIVALLGPNGAGKTSCVDACCGLRRPAAGRVRLLGADVAAGGRAMRSLIGVVPQEAALYPELTGRENLALFAALYDLPEPAARVETLLRLVELWERRDTRVSAYSGGMKRRLALARALLHDPPMLFLDEPTLGVDVQGRRAVWDHVLELRAAGRSVLLTTNYLDEAAALCDRVVIIDHGRLVADASPGELRRQAGSTLVLELDGVAPAAAKEIHRVAPSACVDVDGSLVRVRLTDPSLAGPVVEAASLAGPVRGLRTEEATLDEVFLSLTGRGVR